MSKNARVEEWANFLATQHWDNLDQLAEIIVAETDEEGE